MVEKSRFLTQWVVYSSFGILLVIGFAAITGLLIATLSGGEDVSTSMNSWAPALTMVFAGFVEGYLLGIIQSYPLHKAFPSIPQRDWAVFTAVGGAIAWGIGMFMVPAVSSYVFVEINLISLVAGIGMFCLLTGILGFSQWFVLKKLFPDSWKWILFTIIGWAVGLSVSYLGTLLIQPETSILLTVTISLVFGFLMGAFAALITGLYLTGKIQRRKEDYPPA